MSWVPDPCQRFLQFLVWIVPFTRAGPTGHLVELWILCFHSHVLPGLGPRTFGFGFGGRYGLFYRHFRFFVGFLPSATVSSRAGRSDHLEEPLFSCVFSRLPYFRAWAQYGWIYRWLSYRSPEVHGFFILQLDLLIGLLSLSTALLLGVLPWLFGFLS